MNMAVNRPDRAEQRRKQAEERREAWESMTPQEQLAALDARLGKGEGAKRQRERLVKAMGLVVARAASLVKAKDEADAKKPKMKAKERRRKGV